jgi:hypothetical protein
MRLPRVRFTMRTMMIGVIIAALSMFVVIEIGRLRRVAHLRLQQVVKYTEMEAIFRRDLARLQKDVAWTRRELDSPIEEYKNMKRIAGERLGYIEQAIARSERIVQHAATLKRKYITAASRPWRSVSPDPPTPQ